jgi:DNA-binding MarR family transcriptional regulator
MPADPRDVADRLHSASIHLLRRIRRVDEATGLSAARLSALSVLVFGGSTTLGRLAQAEQVSAPTMSKLVSALERDGLVTRAAVERDGRAVRVSATDRGRRVLAEGRERRIEELAGLLEGLPAEELESLKAAAEIVEDVVALPPSARSAYPDEYRGKEVVPLSDDSTGSGGTSG